MASESPLLGDHDGSLPSRSLLILYATETGNALDAARLVSRELQRIHFKTRVCSTDAYPLTDLVEEELIIFVVSTTGSGSHPRSLDSLWTALLRSDLPEDLFDTLEYAVFGLGDSAYERFCWPARRLTRRLNSLGAHEICSRGEGDEQHRLGIDGALDPWIKELCDALLRLYPLPDELEITPADASPPPSVTIVDCTPDFAESWSQVEVRSRGRLYHKATVKCNQRITAEDWFQDVRHFEFDFVDDIQYNPGDVAIIHPIASKEDVDSVIISLGLSNTADLPVIITTSSNDQALQLPHRSKTTLREVFTSAVDINAVPRRSFFQLLRHFAEDPTELEKLTDFVSNEGADDLYEYTTRVRRTIAEVLADFRSTAARIPRDYIFDLFPPLRSRQFSIASSVKKHPRQIHLCVAIVQYRTRLKLARRGVCTSYLSSLRSGDEIWIGLQRGLITLPKDTQTPVICIGPGTGVAPMRAVIEERIWAGSKENTLYFGCRSFSKDQHYASEWASYSDDSTVQSDGQTEGSLVYRLACSRDGPEGTARTYVQHLIAQDQTRFWELLGNRGGSLFISGSSNKMPAAVRASIREAAKAKGGMSDEGADEFMARIEREGKLIEECWS